MNLLSRTEIHLPEISETDAEDNKKRNANVYDYTWRSGEVN